ncbi:MAG: hypothetical protein Q9164_006307 [Protoblastenia rupestris]
MPEKKEDKDAATNPRGIPYAPFVDKVEDYVSSRADVDQTMKSFQEMISKYQFMEVNTQRRKAGLDEKIPDLQRSLDTVRFLKTRKVGLRSDARLSETDCETDQPDSDPIEATFELNDTLYAKALVPPTEEVYLWLGANVMLSYPVDEAETMLDGKLSGAQQTLGNCEEDLDFLREQITTLEVATARVYNWDVTMRRKEKAEGGADEDRKQRGLPNG